MCYLCDGDNMNRAMIFSIEEFSVFDGPGIRTSVFLKGCPLKCSWCHNPEGQSFANEIIKSQGCTNCGACRATNRIDICPNRLLRYCGEAYSPRELVEKLEGNFEILNRAGGGITFSGGEPLAHPKFLKECLALLQGRVHTAIQTCAYAPNEVFQEIISLSDYVLFDIKLINADKHLHYTGVDNTCILNNFKTLAASNKPFIIRTPLIPEVTDSEENLRDIAQLLHENSIDRIELLPYNCSAGAKYAALGRKFTPDYDETIPYKPRIELFQSFGIRATIL